MTHYFIPLFLFFWKYDILQVLFKYGSDFQFSHRHDSVSEWSILRGRDHPWYTHGLDIPFKGLSCEVSAESVRNQNNLHTDKIGHWLPGLLSPSGGCSCVGFCFLLFIPLQNYGFLLTCEVKLLPSGPLIPFMALDKVCSPTNLQIPPLWFQVHPKLSTWGSASHPGHCTLTS